MTTISVNAPGNLFGRVVRTIATCRGDWLMAGSFAEARGWSDVARLAKAAVSPISTQDQAVAWAPVGYDLSAFLRPLTIIGRLQASMRRAPFRTRLVRASAGGVAKWVADGAPVPATSVSLTGTTELEPMKVGAIVVLTDDLIRTAAAGSDELIAADGAAALVQALDLSFIDPANNGVPLMTPAAVTSESAGAVQFSSSGSTVSAIDADLQKLIGALVAAGASLLSASWVMSPITAAAMALKRGTDGSLAFPRMTARGGDLLGLPVLTSAAVAASGSPGERFIALIEASEILYADEGQAEVEVSTDAAVQLNDAPSNGAQQLVSLWQNNLSGLKVLRFMTWESRRPGAVAVLRDVTY